MRERMTVPISSQFEKTATRAVAAEASKKIQAMRAEQVKLMRQAEKIGRRIALLEDSIRATSAESSKMIQAIQETAEQVAVFPSLPTARF